eukprot:gnl/MRDRNA2_/MRDRNA2_75810_c0_seq1.p1 gnl/MRDRNA2_/MRDRNA2_75810_c0~~gnl/MRDRNA2_/MRDRNA2_75810_c0_seq1.p1  ORF type:complete len:565 (-),score=79.99 gnl/MRDRNA2_/MRDRNA2_75810_c0_seq1:61-1755(-)
MLPAYQMFAALVFGHFARRSLGLRKNATSNALTNSPRLVVPKSSMNGTTMEASHNVFNTSLASRFMNTTGFREDPYWQENWWKDASRNHQPAKHLRSRWQSSKALQHEPVETGSNDIRDKRRIVFLFLVNDHVYHPSLWNAFFEGGQQSQYAAYVHCKNYCNQTMLREMPALKPVDIVPTHYCHNLVDAMVSLLRGALSDGGTPLDKYVFVSDSTLPVKPFSEVFYALGQSSDSDICVFPIDHWAEAAFNNKRAVLVKHHQWVVLNYDHAKVMVKTWGSVDSQGQWSVPIRTTTYSEPLIYNAEKFSRAPIANWCADEWAFFATIFGAIPEDGSASVDVPGYSDRNGSSKLILNGPGTQKMQGTCRTFAFWSDVDPDAARLAKAIAKGHPDNVLSCWPSCTYRPAEVERLSNDGLLQMRRSPFLFARKFSKAITLPKYRDIILKSDTTPDNVPSSRQSPQQTHMKPMRRSDTVSRSSDSSSSNSEQKARGTDTATRAANDKAKKLGEDMKKYKSKHEELHKQHAPRNRDAKNKDKDKDKKKEKENASDWDVLNGLNDAFGDSYR